MIKLTTPEDMSNDDELFYTVLKEIEKSLSEAIKGETYYHVVIVGEYNQHIRDRIIKAYKNIGWKRVECRTSSENDERPGVTGLRLWSE